MDTFTLQYYTSSRGLHKTTNKITYYIVRGAVDYFKLTNIITKRYYLHISITYFKSSTYILKLLFYFLNSNINYCDVPLSTNEFNVKYKVII